MATMAQAMKALQSFKAKQREKGIVDKGNILQQKWDMRDVMDEVPSEHFVKLMRFFLDVDEEKTLDKFFKTYDQYYETMLETIAERKRSRAAVKKTMERLNEQ